MALGFNHDEKKFAYTRLSVVRSSNQIVSFYELGLTLQSVVSTCTNVLQSKYYIIFRHKKGTHLRLRHMEVWFSTFHA